MIDITKGLARKFMEIFINGDTHNLTTIASQIYEVDSPTDTQLDTARIICNRLLDNLNIIKTDDGYTISELGKKRFVIVLDNEKKNAEKITKEAASIQAAQEFTTNTCEWFENFISNYCKNQLLSIENNRLFTLDLLELAKFNTVLADLVIDEPEIAFLSLQAALKKSVVDGIAQIAPFEIEVINLPQSRNLNLAVLNRAHDAKIRKGVYSIECMALHIGKVIQFSSEIIFRCPECEITIPIKQNPNQLVKRPSVCQCGRRGDFESIDQVLRNYQFLIVQEPQLAHNPETLNVILYGPLCSNVNVTDRITSGQQLRITGYLTSLPMRRKNKSLPLSNLYFVASHVEPSGPDRIAKPTQAEIKKFKRLAKKESIIDELVKSFCPSVFGYEEIKEGLITSLVGGIEKYCTDKTKERGNIHLLIMGDPGTSKSKLLQFTAQISQRAMLISAEKSSAVGLTASVEKHEDAGWVLKLGALPLCNNGHLLIDELDKSKREDVQALNDAMERLKFSVNKAGINASLPANTTIIAACNPKGSGRFDPYVDFKDQLPESVSESLFTRFDLTFLTQDKADEQRDRKVAESMHNLEPKAPHDVDQLKKYLAYAREQKPKWKQGVEKLAQDFYVDIRKIRSEYPTFIVTARNYRALCRLAETYAKLRLSRYVEEKDLNRASKLLKFMFDQTKKG